MITFLFLGIVLFFIMYLTRGNRRQAQKAFFFCFLIMFLFAAVRYEFGSDYRHYRDAFFYLKGSNVEIFQSAYHDHMEILFVRFFNLFNSYFVYIMVMSLIWHAVMFWFFKKNVLIRYYHIVILMMFFNANLCILNYVAFRSSLASCFFFIAVICLAYGISDIPILRKSGLVDNKKTNLFFYLLFVFIGSLIHTSLLLFLIFPFVTNENNYSKQLSKWLLYIGITIAVLMPFIGTGYSRLMAERVIDLFSSSFERYETYLDTGSSGVGGLGALLFSLSKVAVAYPILNALTVEKDSRYRRIMQLAVVFIFLLLIIDNIYLSRYMMCFYPVIIAALLRSIIYVSDARKYLSLFALFLLSVSQLYAITHSPFSSFATYQTIFSAPGWQ